MIGGCGRVIWGPWGGSDGKARVGVLKGRTEEWVWREVTQMCRNYEVRC